MARLNYIDYFKRALLEFATENDPLYAMLQWMTEKIMQLEAEQKVGAQNGEHSTERDLLLGQSVAAVRYTDGDDLSLHLVIAPRFIARRTIIALKQRSESICGLPVTGLETGNSACYAIVQILNDNKPA